MKTLAEIREILGEQRAFLTNRYGVATISLFGSYVRGDQKPGSDLDVLVTFEEANYPSLIGLLHLQHYLSDQLQIKVDVVPRDSLKPRLEKQILNEAVPL